MIRVDYEGAWKELKKNNGKMYVENDNDIIEIMGEEYSLYGGWFTIGEIMKDIEQKHTHQEGIKEIYKGGK